MLLIRSPPSPKHDLGRMTMVMFETFRVPALYIANQAIALEQTTGLVFHSGANETCAAPVYEGKIVYINA